MIDSSRLLIDFGNLVGRHTDLRTLLREHDCETPLKEFCETFAELPGIGATLSPLHRERPDLYEFDLFCAALTLPLGAELEYPLEQRGHLFLAALLQDCGQLALSGQAAELAHELHPVAGRQVLAKYKEIPPVVSDLVQNHHERYDGTGFPEGKEDLHLQTADRSLSVVNAAVRIRLAETGNRNLANCPAVLRINQGHRFTRECRALLRVLGCPALSPGLDWTIDNSGARIDDLQFDSACLDQWLLLLKPLSVVLRQLPASVPASRCRRLAQALQYSAASAGVVHKELLGWAEHVRDDRLEEHFPALEELAALQRELFTQLEWVLEFVNRQVESPAHKVPPPEALRKLRDAMRKISESRNRRYDGDGVIMMDV